MRSFCYGQFGFLVTVDVGCGGCIVICVCCFVVLPAVALRGGRTVVGVCFGHVLLVGCLFFFCLWWLLD